MIKRLNDSKGITLIALVITIVVLLILAGVAISMLSGEMNFYEMVLKLKSIYENEIVFVSCGAFYIAIGEDAVILNKELGLQVNCMKRNVCKVGIPKNSIEKYVEKLNELGYSYIVLDFNKENKTLTSIYSKEGQYKQCSIINVNCFECPKNKYNIKTDYEIALERYLAEEVGE